MSWLTSKFNSIIDIFKCTKQEGSLSLSLSFLSSFTLSTRESLPRFALSPLCNHIQDESSHFAPLSFNIRFRKKVSKYSLHSRLCRQVRRCDMRQERNAKGLGVLKSEKAAVVVVVLPRQLHGGLCYEFFSPKQALNVGQPRPR